MFNLQIERKIFILFYYFISQINLHYKNEVQANIIYIYYDLYIL